MTESLWHHLENIETTVRASRYLWIGLDFDGTLTPLVDTPEAAILDPCVRETLVALLAIPSVAIAVISGRALADVREKVGLDGIVFAGNHGLEIEGQDFKHRDAAAAVLSRDLTEIALRLDERLHRIPGVLIEHKILSLSVHYRLSPPERLEFIRMTVKDILRTDSCFEIRAGSNVWEIRPAAAVDKGTAVTFLKNYQTGPNSLAIYIGDDISDEDAFKALPAGITVLVGENRPTSARYQVSSPAETLRFLNWLSLINSSK
jgi:trehalose 6-phosphate phosphatase